MASLNIQGAWPQDRTALWSRRSCSRLAERDSCIVVVTSRWPRSSWTVRMRGRLPAGAWRRNVAACADARAWLGRPAELHWEPHAEDRLVQVASAALAARAVHVDPGGREQPLPDPLATRVRVLAQQRVRQFHSPGAHCQVTLVLGPDAGQVEGQRLLCKADWSRPNAMDRTALLGGYVPGTTR